MTRARVFDSNTSVQLTQIAGGGVKVTAHIARTGVKTYRNPDGSTRRELAVPDELFAKTALDSLRLTPITRGHSAWVSPKNWREVSIGAVGDAKQAPEKRDGQDWIVSELGVFDGEAQADLGTKLVECSLAYSYDRSPEPGITADGEPYEFVQRNYRWNHLALAGAGFARSGEGARVGDGFAGADFPEEEERIMTGNAAPKATVVFDGVSVEQGSDTHISLLTRSLEAEKAKAADGVAKLDTASKQIATLEGEKTALSGRVRELEDNLKKAQDGGVIDAKVNSEIAFRDRIRDHLGKDYSFTVKAQDGTISVKDRKVVLADAIKHIAPKLTFDGAGSVEYLQAIYDTASQTSVIGDGIEYTEITSATDGNDALRAGMLQMYQPQAK